MRTTKYVEGPRAEADAEERRVHTWRVNQLAKLGLPWPAAEAAADTVDWHDVARLVERGCPAELAVTILV
jgi:hypothetical protein